MFWYPLYVFDAAKMISQFCFYFTRRIRELCADNLSTPIFHFNLTLKTNSDFNSVFRFVFPSTVNV